MPALHSIVNPVTRSEVQLVPPVEVRDENDVSDVVILVARRCKEAWDRDRTDLTEIRDLRGIVFGNASG